MTATLTPDALQRLDRYLGQVRVLLRGAPNLDADEVERDIRAHIDAELGGTEAPVGAQRLEEVLQRLGSPSQWVGEEEIPPWRRLLARLLSGEDWRLAYLCLATTGVGLLLTLAGTPIGLAFFAAGYVLGRAAVALADERGEPLGARRWLIVGSIAVVVIPVLFALLAGPLLPLGPVGYEEGWYAGTFIGQAAADPPGRAALVYTGLIALALGVWWLVLAGLWGVLWRLLGSFARPIYEPRAPHRRWLAIAGLALVVIGCALLLVAGKGDILASAAGGNALG